MADDPWDIEFPDYGEDDTNTVQARKSTGALVLCICGIFTLMVGLTCMIWSVNKNKKPIASQSESPIVNNAVRQTITVDVKGDVVHPGLIRLPVNARVEDALKAAGGVVHQEDVAGLNLAAFLDDGQELDVTSAASTPRNPVENTGGSVGLPSPTGQIAPQIIGKVDVNVATVNQLETIPGIGPKRAAAIVEERTAHGPFTSLQDLHRVRGIGTVTISHFSQYLVVPAQKSTKMEQK